MVQYVVNPMVPLDRARRAVSGTLSNSVENRPCTNPRWKYFGKYEENPVFGVSWADGLGGSGRGWYHSIELVEMYLDHYQTQLEHVPERILGGNTLESKQKPSIWVFLGRWVARLGSPRVPFDRACRFLSGTLANSVGTRSWANPRWKYSGKYAKNPVFGNFWA